MTYFAFDDFASKLALRLRRERREVLSAAKVCDDFDELARVCALEERHVLVHLLVGRRRRTRKLLVLLLRIERLLLVVLRGVRWRWRRGPRVVRVLGRVAVWRVGCVRERRGRECRRCRCRGGRGRGRVEEVLEKRCARLLFEVGQVDVEWVELVVRQRRRDVRGRLQHSGDDNESVHRACFLACCDRSVLVVVCERLLHDSTAACLVSQQSVQYIIKHTNCKSSDRARGDSMCARTGSFCVGHLENVTTNIPLQSD